VEVSTGTIGVEVSGTVVELVSETVVECVVEDSETTGAVWVSCTTVGVSDTVAVGVSGFAGADSTVAVGESTVAVGVSTGETTVGVSTTGARVTGAMPL
jgi:hypothetical protein